MATKLEGIGFGAKVVSYEPQKAAEKPKLPSAPAEVQITRDQRKIVDSFQDAPAMAKALEIKFIKQGHLKQLSPEPEKIQSQIDVNAKLALEYLSEVEASAGRLSFEEKAMVQMMEPKDRARYLLEKKMNFMAERESAVMSIVDLTYTG